MVGSTGAVPKRSAQYLRRANSERGTRSGETGNEARAAVGADGLDAAESAGHDARSDTTPSHLWHAGPDGVVGAAAVSALRVGAAGDAAVLGRGQFEAELQDISRGGCFFKSNAAVALDRRISVVLSANGGKTCQASGRVVRTVAYRASPSCSTRTTRRRSTSSCAT